MKLTKAQARILGELPVRISDYGTSHKPALKLVELGLATVYRPKGWEHPKYTRTPAGDEELQKRSS